jgi:hypothetical protein
MPRCAKAQVVGFALEQSGVDATEYCLRSAGLQLEVIQSEDQLPFPPGLARQQNRIRLQVERRWAPARSENRALIDIFDVSSERKTPTICEINSQALADVNGLTLPQLSRAWIIERTKEQAMSQFSL